MEVDGEHVPVGDEKKQEVEEKEEEGEEEEEDDAVVMTLPVFLSHNCVPGGGPPVRRKQVQVWQFPLRPRDRPYEQTNPRVSCAVRKRFRRVELEYLLEKDPTYDAGANYPVESFQLRSQPQPMRNNYMVAMLSKGEVHLTPVHVVQQFRPTFEHCEQDSREDTLSEKTGGVIPFSRRKQTDRQIELMAKSYPYFAASEADDRLEAFRLYQSHESEARVQRQQLLFKKHATIGNVAGTGGVHSDVAAESNRGHDFELLPREYLDKVFPTTPDGYGEQSSSSSFLRSSSSQSSDLRNLSLNRNFKADELVKGGIFQLRSFVEPTTQFTMPRPSHFIRNQLKKMPIKDRIRSILEEGRMARIEDLMTLCGVSDPGTLLPDVVDLAVYVNGVWVLKSNLVFPERPSLAALRDWLLLRFKEDGFVHRKAVLEKVDVDREALHFLVHELAVRQEADRVEDRVWRLRISPSGLYPLSESFPQVAEEQEQFWDFLSRELETTIQVHGSLRHLENPEVSHQSSRGSGNHVMEHLHMELEEDDSDQNREALREFFTGCFRKYHVCSMSWLVRFLKNCHIKKGGVNAALEDILGPDGTLPKLASREVMEDVVQSIAVHFGHAYMLRYTGDPHLDKIRALLAQMVQSSTTFAKQTLINDVKVQITGVPSDVVGKLTSQAITQLFVNDTRKLSARTGDNPG